MTQIEPDDLIFQAKTCHQLSKNRQAFEYLIQLVRLRQSLDDNQRECFSGIVQGTINPLRASIHTLNTYHESAIEEKKIELAQIVQKYQKEAQDELLFFCKTALDLINSVLLINADTVQERIFWHRMRGDIYRYIVECDIPDEKGTAMREARVAYDAAISICDDNLILCDPNRLLAIFNAAIFEYEYLNEPSHAISILQEAIHSSEKFFDQLPPQSQPQAKKILYSMRTNLMMWSNNDDDQGT